MGSQCAGAVLHGGGAEGGVTLVHQLPGTLVLLSSVAQGELTLARVPRPAAGRRLAGERVNLVQHGWCLNWGKPLIDSEMIITWLTLR